MHKPAIAPLVFSRLFPNLKASDPTSLPAHIVRNLIPEVRSETVCFYGPIDCLEAQYPGLDYANPAHRLRLRQHTWHRKLFQVFDELRLSEHEIQTLCRWEGTRWARERYEKDEGVKIRDTTWDGVESAVYQEPTATRVRNSVGKQNKDELENPSDDEVSSDDESVDERMGDSDDQSEEAVDEESEDELQHSVGEELHQRLLRATEARARGEEAILDEDWEQWLKEAAERGVVPDILDIPITSFDETRAENSRTYGRLIPEAVRLNSEIFYPPRRSSLRPPLSTPPYIPLRESNAALATVSPSPPSGTAMSI